MKRNITYCLFFYMIFGFSQEKINMITYKKITTEQVNTENNYYKNLAANNPKVYRSLIDNYKLVPQVLEFLDFTLYATQTEALFKVEDFADLPANYSGAIAFALPPKGLHIYYNNLLTNKRLVEYNFAGEKYIVNDEALIWNMTQKQQVINGYVCYQAITHINLNSAKDDEKLEVVAWYSPQIPVPFGPIGFTGLPGLIIKLEYQQSVYQVSKIKLNTKKPTNIQIAPLKGKQVTQVEFYNFMKEANSKVKSFFKN